jgi:hypothetical protein
MALKEPKPHHVPWWIGLALLGLVGAVIVVGEGWGSPLSKWWEAVWQPPRAKRVFAVLALGLLLSQLATIAILCGTKRLFAVKAAPGM